MEAAIVRISTNTENNSSESLSTSSSGNLANNSSMSSAINLAHYSFAHSQQLRHIETPTSHILVFGTIQHQWFYDDHSTEEQFCQKQYQTTFYQQLNGHFSLVIIAKNENKIRLVANRSGGFRLHCLMENNEIIISNNLQALNIEQPNFDRTALRETLEYRWNSGESSLLFGVNLLPSSCYWDIENTNIVSKQYYALFPVPVKEQNTIEQQALQTSDLLTQAMVDAVKPNSKVAVLLSGGVDSSVLAALASKKIANLVAISHRSPEHGNPELDTAITFAKELGIAHRIIEVSDDDIKKAFVAVTKIIEQPPRYQSSLILYTIFQAIGEDFDQILYGEAADTLFGTSLVKRWKLRQHKQTKLASVGRYIPFIQPLINLLPDSNKFKLLQNENLESYALSSSRLSLSENAERHINRWAPKKQALRVLSHLISSENTDNIAPATVDLAKLKSFLMRTDRDNHFHETGVIANQFGLELISPFVDYRVINYAAKLQDDSYFGQDFVKPILRKIGEQYFTPELMYLPKLGFPAPHEIWMKGVLQSFWQDAKQHFSLHEDYENDVEFKWTMASLAILAQHLHIED